jgi:cytochrome c nitrite reductase small subunit
MSEHFAAWTRGSHHAVATCNDCHTPHTPIGKYIVKARNGFWHSVYFTTGRFPDPLRITESNRQVTENTCRYCHAPITDGIDHGSGDVPRTRAISAAGPTAPGRAALEPLSCVRCHPHVGHWVR